MRIVCAEQITEKSEGSVARYFIRILNSCGPRSYKGYNQLTKSSFDLIQKVRMIANIQILFLAK